MNDLRKAAEQAREALAKVPSGLTASYDEKDAEWRGHDKAGDRANKIVHEVRDLCAHAIAALDAALAADAPNGWRPIETVPKDGRAVLLYFPKRYSGNGGVSWGCFINGRWLDSRAIEDNDASHWMPMPDPPHSALRHSAPPYDAQTIADTAAIVASGETTTDMGTSHAYVSPTVALDAALAVEGDRHLTLDEQQVMHSALRRSATVVEATPSDAELVGIWSCEYDAWWRPNACGYTKDSACAGVWPKAEAEKIADSKKEKHLIARTIPIHPEAAAAIERLTRLCAAYEGTIKADERELDNDYETIERLRQALAAEREVHEATQRRLDTMWSCSYENVAADWKARAEAAEARVRELEAKASSPGP